MNKEIIDPLYRCITVSDSNIAGSHPFKHQVDPLELEKTISQPDSIFGHTEYSTRCCYIRCRKPEDGFDEENDLNHMCQAVVEMDTPIDGHVVTSFYTDWLSKTVNVNDKKYKNKN
jgi:hypothetical protein